ncbi:MAG: hypothetical protein KF893_20145 [Caldilineaceae bacterium]|nr:hypothetical protein [Caldilineaceae bacterium]
MALDSTNRQSHLFTLRLWTEEVEEGQTEWRGRVHYVTSDEVRYFRDWPSLIPLLLAMLRDGEQKHTLPELLQALAPDGDRSKPPAQDERTA